MPSSWSFWCQNLVKYGQNGSAGVKHLKAERAKIYIFSAYCLLNENHQHSDLTWYFLREVVFLNGSERIVDSLGGLQLVKRIALYHLPSCD